MYDLFSVRWAVFIIPECPERVSFQNEVCNAFTPHEIERVSLRRSRPHGLSDTRAPLAHRFYDFRTKFTWYQFTWYQNEISCQKKNFFRNENRNELTLG